MKKFIYIVLVTIALGSCNVTVTDSEPSIPTSLEGEILTDRYGRTYVLNHNHYHMSQDAYTVLKINDVVIINDTVYVEEGFDDGLSEGYVEYESKDDF